MLLAPIYTAALLPVHAATGTVCFSSDGTTCATLIGGAAGSTITVDILITASDPLNGFDVQVLADPTILSAPSVSSSLSIGPVLGSSPSIVAECINGIALAGVCSAQDGLGVVHVAAAKTGANVAGTGVLFAIKYNVLTTTLGSPVVFNTGCSGTSVSPSTCVTITNGTVIPNVETVQSATFANISDFVITASPNPVQTPPGVASSSILTLTAEGTFFDLVNLAIGSATLPASLSSPTVDLTTARTGTDTLSVGPAVAGTYTVVVNAVGTFTTNAHSVTVTVRVGPADFSLSAAPASLTISRGGSDTSTITVTPISGFTGSVTLSAMTATGVMASFGTNPVTGGSGTSTLTVSVSGSAAIGSSSILVTGTGSSGSHTTTVALTVPAQDFSISASPNALSVPRGSSAVSTINLISLGNFQGSITLTATVTNQGTDSAGLTTNVIPSFLPSTVTLPAGGSLGPAFFASTVKGGPTPSTTDTATGNYTATITATSGSIIHIIPITFNVFDVRLGPAFCPGSTEIDTTPNGNFPQVFVGSQCTTLTITNQTVASGGAPGTLFLQVTALGGYFTSGAVGLGVGGVNPQIPVRGVFVPELGRKRCLVQTFFANGTQVPYAFLRANGPIIRPGDGSGCRFNAIVFPNDVAGGFAGVLPPPLPQSPFNNPDFFAITAESLTNTVLGTYIARVCALAGTLFNCIDLTVVVVGAPVIHQFNFAHRLSLSKTASTQSFKVGVISADPTMTLSLQITITGIDQAGDTFTVLSPVITLAPGQTINNIILSTTLTTSEIGQSFAFSTSVAVGIDPARLTGTSTVTFGKGLPISSTFIVLS